MPDKDDSPALAETLTSGPGLEKTVAATPGLEETAAATSSPGIAVPEVARVDRYVIKKRLGAGGMGVVYVATDPELGRDVAIKMLKSGAHAERLKREAQALARLDHRNVVTVHDVGEHEGRVFVAMALVDGQNLGEWLKTEHTTEEIIDVLLQASRGIIAAHEAGLIHRDLKPDNIFVARDGNVLVGDFGLARDADDDDGQGFDAVGPAMSLTQTGHVLGTPAYMAPEQAAGEASERSDQFSFCVTAYEALYGTRPFVGSTFEEILDRVDSGELEQPKRRRKVPGAITAAIRRGLDADPAKRWPSMQALIAAWQPPRRRVWPWVAAGGVLLAGGGVALAIALGGDKQDAAASCDGVAAEIDAAWSTDRRAKLVAHIGSRLTPHAADDLAARLDAYRQGWVSERKATCIAAASKQIDARTAAARGDCLALARIALDQTAQAVLADTTPDLRDLTKRTAALPPVEHCSSPDALRLAVAGDAHHQLLTDLRIASRGFDPSAYAALRARAESAHDLPAQLEIALSEASSALDERAFATADAALKRALPLAEQLDVAGARVRVHALTAQLACTQGAQPDASLTLAEAAGKRLDPKHHAFELLELLEARANCLMRLPDPAPAIPALEELIRRNQERYGTNEMMQIEARNDLAMVLRRVGRAKEAMEHEERVIATLGRYTNDTLAAGHQAAAASSEALMAGDVHTAVEHQRRAVQLFTHDILKAQALATLAMYYDVLLDWRTSAATQTEVLDLISKFPDDDRVQQMRADAHAFRGAARLYLGDAEAASADFEAALPLAQKHNMVEPTAVSQIGLGRAWVLRKEPQRAIGLLRDGLATHAKLGDQAAFRVGLAHYALAQALWALDDKTAARDSAKQAELAVAKGIEQSRENPGLGKYGLPFRQKILDEIIAWRDAHK